MIRQCPIKRIGWGCIAAAIVVSADCGKKGPPLAPFSRVPALITAVTPQRVGDDVYLSFKVPDTNADGQKPATIGAVEMYAVTSAVPPSTDEQRELAQLIATVPVRPILPELPIPANGSAPPPIPIPPGVDQGATVIVREILTADARTPVELPVDKPRVESETATDEPFIGPLVAPPPTELPRRHYFAVAVSSRSGKSPASTPVSVPLESGSSAPGQPELTYTASEMTISWPPSPDARTATIQLPPTVKPEPSGANATPSNLTPATVTPSNQTPSTVPSNQTPSGVKPSAPAGPAPLAAKSLGFNSVATTYAVFDVSAPASGAEAPAPDPYAITQPAPLVPASAATELVLKGVTFGVERCFVVRPVDQVFGVTVIGPASPKACITPLDTFPPAAPRSLQAIAGSGVINLIWEANSEPDLAGYMVLRGEAPGDTLQAITTEPVTGTTYRDETVRPGTRYVFAVVAVDRAEPRNVSAQSNRAEETARQ